MRPEKRIKIALLFVLFFLCAGSLGYMAIEGYSAIDAFYMTVITVSTVGYGEVHPLSSIGRIFTVVLILLSVGSLAILAGAFSEMLIERSANPNRWKLLMERRISKLSGHVIICGHGRVGAAAAKHFYGNGCPFVVIEQLEEQVKELRALGFHVLEGDGTREESLLRANIKSAESLLAVMDSDPENLFAVLTARELNPMLHIIARTDDPSSESRMLRAGADSIISPFISAGKSVAESLMKAKNVIEKEAWAKDYDGARLHWVEVRTDSDLCGLTIAEAKQKVGSDIIGVRSDGKDQLMPGGDYVLYAQDELLLSANGENPVIVDATPKKIGFIDDNPVILRLYTRLFQKAGFTVVSAVTGAEGLEMVDNHDLDCLIVDYHLPDMTGVDVCEKLHKSSEGDGVKTFIFTADNQEQIKTVASTVGVDKVVIKSADAGEIVSLVSSELL